MKSTIENFRKFDFEEEETQNRVMFEDLKMLLGKHGFIVGLAKLEGFSMAVTKYGKSRNDHCFMISVPKT